MKQIAEFLASAIGRKILMGLTGLLLIGFLIVHMSGNLLVFAGAEAYNEYSHALVSNHLIYLAEFGLLVLFLAHLISGILVYRRNREARPIGYEVSRWAGHTSHKSWASVTMIVSGVVILVFVPIHLMKFKFGTYYEFAGHPGMRDLHRLVNEEFRHLGWVLFYVVVMVVIGFHLWHGFGSGLESLGVRHRVALRRLGQVIAVIVAGGFILVPVVIYLTGGVL